MILQELVASVSGNLSPAEEQGLMMLLKSAVAASQVVFSS
jgi:hypothetical protein